MGSCLPAASLTPTSCAERVNVAHPSLQRHRDQLPAESLETEALEGALGEHIPHVLLQFCCWGKERAGAPRQREGASEACAPISPDPACLFLLLGQLHFLPALNLSHEYDDKLRGMDPSREPPNVVVVLGTPARRSFQQLLLISVVTLTRDKLGALRLQREWEHLCEEGKAPRPSGRAPPALAGAPHTHRTAAVPPALQGQPRPGRLRPRFGENNRRR